MVWTHSLRIRYPPHYGTATTRGTLAVSIWALCHISDSFEDPEDAHELCVLTVLLLFVF